MSESTPEAIVYQPCSECGCFWIVNNVEEFTDQIIFRQRFAASVEEHECECHTSYEEK